MHLWSSGRAWLSEDDGGDVEQPPASNGSSVAPQQRPRAAWQAGGAAAGAAAAAAAAAGGAGSQPVCIPEPRVLPYSRLRSAAGSASSVSPGPGVLLGSPGAEEILVAAQQQGGSPAVLPQQLPALRPRGADAPAHRRPPLPPSPQARPPLLSASLGAAPAPAWILPGSGSGGRTPRLLAAAASSSSSAAHPGPASAGSHGALQQLGGHSSSLAGSPSPSSDGLLASAVAAEGVAAAAGNPHHPQHQAAMQLLLQHQQQQLQALQAQQAALSSAGLASSLQRTGSGSGPFCGSVGASPQSPAALHRSSSYGRLAPEQLGTSPGLIEASFMGLAARPAPQPSSVGRTRSATLQQLQASLLAQEQHARALQHSRSAVSFGDWGERPESRGGQLAGLPGTVGAGSSDGSSQGWEQQQPGAHASALRAEAAAAAAGAGMRALPGRQGLHWLSHAGEGESAARGLLGLPRCSSSNARQPLGRDQQQQQQQQQQQLGSSLPHGSLRRAASSGALGAAGRRGSGELQRADPEAPAGVSDPSSSAAAEAAAGGGGRSPRSPSLRLGRSLSRRGSFSAGLGRSASSVGLPTCLICLDQLTPDDFECGEAMVLDCRCKGEVALRHRQCAEKWSRIKGSTVCDVCKAPIRNLPDVPPLPPPPPPGGAGGLLGEPGGGWGDGGGGLWGIGDEPPAAADYVFDCIRVTWVVLIVCILFFELSVSRSFITGALLGSAYVALSASWAAAARRRRRQMAAAAIWAANGHAAAAAATAQQEQQQQRVPLLAAEGGLPV